MACAEAAEDSMVRPARHQRPYRGAEGCVATVPPPTETDTPRRRCPSPDRITFRASIIEYAWRCPWGHAFDSLAFGLSQAMHLVHTAQQSWGISFIRLLCPPPPRSFTHTHLQLKQITLTIYNLEHIGMWRAIYTGY